MPNEELKTLLRSCHNKAYELFTIIWVRDDVQTLRMALPKELHDEFRKHIKASVMMGYQEAITDSRGIDHGVMSEALLEIAEEGAWGPGKE